MKRPPIVQTKVITNPTRTKPQLCYLQTWVRVGKSGCMFLIHAQEVANG